MLRDPLIDRSILRHIVDTGQAFEDVDYETVILIGSRRSTEAPGRDYTVSAAHPLRTALPQKTIVNEGIIPFSLLDRHNIIIFRGLSDEELRVVDAISSRSIFLFNILEPEEDIFRGPYIPDNVKQQVLTDLRYTRPDAVPEDQFIWINKVPHVKRYRIVRYHLVDPTRSNNLTYMNKVEKTRVPRLFIKVLRGNRLVSYSELSGEVVTTGKLVNVVLQDTANYGLNFLCGLINSPYPSFYLASVLFSKTTETSRVMDHAYSSLIPIPQIEFTASSEALQSFRATIEGLLTQHIEEETDLDTQNVPERAISFIDDIQNLIGQHVSDHRSHGLYEAIDLIVGQILTLNTDTQTQQEQFIQYVGRQYTRIAPETPALEEKEVICKLMEKVGHMPWAEFRGELTRHYRINQRDYEALAERYEESLLWVKRSQYVVQVLEIVVDELIRHCFELTEDDKQIVIESLRR